MAASKPHPDIAPFHVMAVLERARELERCGHDIIHMEIGEPDFPTPAAVCAAAAQALATADIKYTAAGGLPELRGRIADFYRQRHGVDLPPHRIFVTPGASGALLLALTALIAAGDEVLVADPGYPCYRNFIKALHGTPRGVDIAATDMQLSPQSLRQAWGDRSAGLILASPANPTGAVASAGLLAELAAETESRRGFLLCDEIYHGLEYGLTCRTALAISPRTFVINSFSKYFGMTGWRLGWLVAPEAYCGILERLAQNLFICAPTLAQLAALRAFDPANLAELEQRRAAFQQRRDFLYDALSAAGFRPGAKPAGAFYLYTDCSGFGMDSDRLCRELLESAHVAVTSGQDFGQCQAERYLRFAYTRPIEQLADGVERIRRFLGR